MTPVDREKLAMTWKNTLNDELNNLARRGVAGASEKITVAAPEGQLECDVTSVDVIGGAFRRFALETDRLSGHSVDELKALSERLSAQINYLLEPISPIEIDHEGATVQMRSNPPQKDDDGTKYYELLVRKSGLALYRYSRPQGQARTTLAANVTREVLVRLAEDFVEAVK